MDIRHICYTPLAVHVTDIIKRKCLVLTGTKDKWFLEADIQKLKGLMDIGKAQNSGQTLRQLNLHFSVFGDYKENT